MNAGSLTRMVGFFRTLAGAPHLGAQADGRLLERFAQHRDQAAFAELLDRHGSLVLGVCRRVLQQEQDAEDAFQATFLVLVRKAGSLTSHASLAGWLSTVAYRIALRVRAGKARRPAQELQNPAEPTAPESEEAAWRELRPVLDEELQKLPEKYRMPILLCYFEGKTNEEAAQHLGWTKGTVSGRLARARDLLRGRLTRRGITLSAGGVVAILTQQAAASTGPGPTLRAALSNIVAGEEPASAVAAQLADGFVFPMSHSGLKIAAVLVVLGGLATAAVLLRQPSPAEREPPRREQAVSPALVVEAVFPGAGPEKVADQVAAPLERQLRDVDNLLLMTSRADLDGLCVLTLTFKEGTDLNAAQAAVRSGIERALPDLPELVKRQEVTVRKKAPGVAAFLTLHSPDASLDVMELENHAALILQDKLAQVPGVNGVSIVATRQYSMPAPLTRDGAGSLPQTDQFQLVPLKDVDRPAAADKSEISARWNGKPAAVLAIYPTPEANPRDVVVAVQSALAGLREPLPKGIRLDMPLDLSTTGESASRDDMRPEYFLVDPILPDGASMVRVLEVLSRCEAIVRTKDGVTDTLTLTAHPFDERSGQACLLVRLGPATRRRVSREQILRSLRQQFADELRDGIARLRDLSAPSVVSRQQYAVDLGVHGPDEQQARALAALLLDRLGESGKVTDLSPLPSRSVPALSVDVDREKAKMFGVSMEVAFAAIQTHLGSTYVRDFNQFARRGSVEVQLQHDLGRLREEDIKNIKVRNADGEQVPLGAFVTVFATTAGVIERLNGEPMVRLTASLAGDTSLLEVHLLCEELVEEARRNLRLPPEYRLTWLREMQTGR